VLAVASTDPLVYIGGGTIVTLVALSMTLLIRMVRTVPGVYADGLESQRAQIEQLEGVVGGLRLDLVEADRRQRRCDRTNTLLVRALVREGIEVPREVWDVTD
jgi:hypothetical protein